MTTIGLVSAGLLTFPQGLGLVFGANIGTTGTGWLVALFGVRVSLSAAALPIMFVGRAAQGGGRGRMAAAGARDRRLRAGALRADDPAAGHGRPCGKPASVGPADGPGGAGCRLAAGMVGLLLVVVGLVMTAVMQSSTAAIAVTLSASFAGAVGLDQGCRAGHRAEHRHGDQLGRRRDRRERPPSGSRSPICCSSWSRR